MSNGFVSPNEAKFYNFLQGFGRQPGIDAVLVGIRHLGLNEKQAYSWMDKWSRKGWWDYGVTLRSGWFTAVSPMRLEPPEV